MRTSITSIACKLVVFGLMIAAIASTANAQFPSEFTGTRAGNNQNRQGGFQRNQGQSRQINPGRNPQSGGLGQLQQFGQDPTGYSPNPNLRQNARNPKEMIVGKWVVSAKTEEGSFQGQLTLEANGQCQITFNGRSKTGTTQYQSVAQWDIQNKKLMFNSDGEVERYNYVTDGRVLAVDMPELGIRIGFARDERASFIEPLPQNQPQQNQYQQNPQFNNMDRYPASPTDNSAYDIHRFRR